MTPNSGIHLKDFFDEMNNYTIMKMDDCFPLFNKGKDDVDILCLNIEDIIYTIIRVLKKKYPEFTYKVIKFNKNLKQVDLFKNNKFIYKFDLISDLGRKYTKFKIPKEISQKVINNSSVKKGFYVPKIEDELMIRQLEYDTYIKNRPDKIKHLKFINKHENINFIKFPKNIN
jgi:hypothetical protein